MDTAQYTEFLSIDWTLFFMLANTLILFLLMKKFFFLPVKKMIDSREQEIDQAFKDADATKAEAEALKVEYAKSIAGAKDEAAEIVGNAHKTAQMRADEIISDAKAKSVAILQRTEEEVKREKKKAINEIKGEISSIAMEIATKVVEKDINAKDHEKLISQFIDGVGEV